MSKPKKHFLVAVKGQPDWFQAVTQQEAGPGAVHIEALGNKIYAMTSPDYSYLLTQMVEKTPGVKEELSLAIAQRIIADPARFQELYAQTVEAEQWERKTHLDMDVEEKLFLQLAEELGTETLALAELERLEDDLAYLRNMPDSSYRSDPSLERILQVSATLGSIKDTLTAQQSVSADAIAASLQNLQNQDLVEFLFAMTSWRRDRYTRGVLMAHWQDAGHHPDGRLYDGFFVEGQRYIRREAVERLTAPAP